MSRVALAASVLACALVVPRTTGAAGAVIPLGERPEPAFVDVRMALAVTPTSSVRWTELTVPPETAAMWLVPVRPGAAIDWAPARWLDALDEATAPRVLPPSSSTTCPSRSTPEASAPWTAPRSKRPAPALAVQTTAEGARAYAAERGYRLGPALSDRITALYASGWSLVALELSPSSSPASTGTLRVSDDGGPILPLALSGESSTRLTVFVVGSGGAAVAGTRDVDGRALRWGPQGSTYATWRSELVQAGGGAAWLRESSSHDVLFDGAAVPGDDPIASVVAGYFRGSSCVPPATPRVGASDGVVGRSCAPGAAARVPGRDEQACTASSGDIDPAALSCGADVDLALALEGLSPANAVVTRLAGWIPAGALGSDLGVGFEPVEERPPLIRAGAYEECAPPLSALRPPPPSGGAVEEEEVFVPASDGCGGTVVAGTTYVEEEPEEDVTSTESCGGDGSSSGWDDEPTDSCSSDDSSSSDSCSGGSSSSSSGGSDDGWDTEDDSDDGWDTEDDMSPKRKKIQPASKGPHAKAKRRRSSPVSRYALLAVALLLPLRRRSRAST